MCSLAILVLCIIGEIYRVLSNGILVKKMSPALMEIIDVLEISKYSEMKESVEEIRDYLNPLSKKYHFTYYIKETNYFNEIDTISLLLDGIGERYSCYFKR